MLILEHADFFNLLDISECLAAFGAALVAESAHRSSAMTLLLLACRSDEQQYSIHLLIPVSAPDEYDVGLHA